MSALRCTIASFLITACGASAAAQEPLPAQENAEEASEGVISYTPADFAAARPNTALDMVNRLPGFQVDRGDQVRGYAGGAGNVLIDGQRPASKNESIQDTLARIPIAQVERVDVIRGGAPGIDMQGRSVVANVIRTRVDTFQQTVSANGWVFLESGLSPYALNYEATRRSGERQYDFQLNRYANFDDSSGDATRTTEDAETGELLLFEDSVNEGQGYGYNGRLNYKGPLLGGTLSVNTLLNTNEWNSESFFFTDVSDRRFTNQSTDDSGEIGLNFTLPLSPSLDVETIALMRLSSGEGSNVGVVDASSSLLTSEYEAGESIGRAVLHYTRSPTLSFEGGGEVAFNFREQLIALTVDGAAFALPASDVRVEELRGEVFGQGTWRISPRYSLEAGVRVEESTITQSGDTALERSFTYPKPRVLLTWSPRESDQVRFRIEQQVGQLNFRDFASNVNLNSSVLSAGNAELKPAQTLSYEVAYERRFWGNGAAVFTFRHEDISDVVDVAPFRVFVDANSDGLPDDADNDGVPDQMLVTGPGNIGDADNDVFALNLTLPLSRFGIDGGELKVDATYQDGEVLDPLTGDPRRISGRRPYNVRVNYRHDIPSRHLTFGVFFFPGWSERYYRLSEFQVNELRDYWETFIEYKPTNRLTMAVGLNNVNQYSFKIERNVFDGPRDTGSPLFIETERRESQVLATARIRLTFD